MRFDQWIEKRTSRKTRRMTFERVGQSATLTMSTRPTASPSVPGSNEGLETFRELYRQVFTLRNERSTILSIEKFVPLLPAKATRKILAEFLAERKAMEQRSPEENATLKAELLRPKKTVG
jgi:hypothetical protein